MSDIEKSQSETASSKMNTTIAVSPLVEDLAPSAKRRILRKIDLHLLPPLACLYLISYMDRNSLANASIFGYKTDVHINTTQYNLIATVFFFTYAAFEIPAMIALHHFKPSTWIAFLCFAWGTVMTLSGLVHNYAGAITSRLALGVAEAGFFPAAIYLMSTWYSREELQVRVSILYAVGTFSGAFTGLLAYAISYMNGVGGLSGFRWLYILEGLFTVLLAVFIKLLLPDSFETVSWLGEADKAYLRQVRATRGDSNGLHSFKKSDILLAVKDYKVWMVTWICVCQNVTLFGYSYTLPSILTQMGFTATKAQLMTVPLYAVACTCCLIGAFIATKMHKRSPMIIFGYSLALVGLIATMAAPKDRMVHVRYFFLFFILSGLYIAYPAALTWCSNNAAGPGKRSVATALQLTIGNLSSAIGTNTYLAKQKPKYTLGYGLAIGVVSSGVLMALALLLCLKWENEKKKKDETVYSEDELVAMGDKAPTFVYSY